MKLHEKFHTGDTFACDYCDKHFPRLDFLKSHTRKHTGEKLFKCGYCNKGFTKLASAKKHEKDNCKKKKGAMEVTFGQFNMDENELNASEDIDSDTDSQPDSENDSEAPIMDVENLTLTNLLSKGSFNN